MFRNKVVVFYTLQELKDACDMYPDIFIRDKYFNFYFSGRYEFPMIVWNFEKNNLYHTDLNNIRNFDEFYVEKIRQSVDWSFFKKNIKE